MQTAAETQQASANPSMDSLSPNPPSRSVNQLTREEREELNALSKRVYGASSRWKKLVEQGYAKLVTEDVTEYVPNEKDPEAEGTTRVVQVPSLYKGKIKYSRQTRHTVDSIKAEMLDRKAKIEEIEAIIAKQRAEAQAKKDAEIAKEAALRNASGSALSPRP